MTQADADTWGEMAVAPSFDLPCDASEHELRGHGPARWILWVHVCCEACPPQILYCDGCLDEVMADESLRGCADCGYVVRPIRRRILRVEPIGAAA